MAKDRKIDMVLLGLLAHENLSGYDMKKRIDNSISFFWKGSFGSIYPSLTAMTQEGLVTRIESEEEKGGREKILYSITDKGRRALEEWLNEDKMVNDMRYEILLKTFFGGIADEAVTLKNIELFEEEVERSLFMLKMYQEKLADHLDERDHVHYYMTVSFGVEVYQAYLNWCRESKKLLKNHK